MKVSGPVNVEDSVRTPVAPSPERLRDFYFEATERLTLGLVRYVDNSFRLGPLTLITLGEAARTARGWSFPITGGLLAAQPGGGRCRSRLPITSPAGASAA